MYSEGLRDCLGKHGPDGGRDGAGAPDTRLAAPAGTKQPCGRQNILHTEAASLFLGGWNSLFKGKVSLGAFRSKDGQETGTQATTGILLISGRPHEAY